MDRENILRAALAVGLTFELPPTKLIQFAQIIAALEREECAKLCEETDDGTPYNQALECADAIRSRGE